MLGIRPEALDSVDVVLALGKLVGSVMHPVMLFIAQINQAVIGWSTIALDDGFPVDFASDNPLECGFRAIRNDLGEEATTSFMQSEHNGFSRCDGGRSSFHRLR